MAVFESTQISLRCANTVVYRAGWLSMKWIFASSQCDYNDHDLRASNAVWPSMGRGDGFALTFAGLSQKGQTRPGSRQGHVRVTRELGLGTQVNRLASTSLFGCKALAVPGTSRR